MRTTLLALATVTSLAAALPTREDALKLAFPGATFTRKEHFLTEIPRCKGEAAFPAGVARPLVDRRTRR